MDILALIPAVLCGFRAYALYRAAPINAIAWFWTGAWAVGAIASLIALF